jgi:hypothetical protein
VFHFAEKYAKKNNPEQTMVEMHWFFSLHQRYSLPLVCEKSSVQLYKSLTYCMDSLVCQSQGKQKSKCSYEEKKKQGMA